MNDLREALDQISLNELAQRARVATATITRLKLRGEFTRTSASGRIRHVLVADGLWPKDGLALMARGGLSRLCAAMGAAMPLLLNSMRLLARRLKLLRGP